MIALLYAAHKLRLTCILGSSLPVLAKETYGQSQHTIILSNASKRITDDVIFLLGGTVPRVLGGTGLWGSY